jgi:solute:Na+ symporter, SSS family
MITIAITLFVYILLTTATGLWTSRRQDNLAYVTAPGGTPTVVLVVSLLATIVGGGMFLGVTELGFEGGLPCFALGVSYLVGSIVMAVLAPTIRKACADAGVISLSGLLERRYPHKALAYVFSGSTFFVFLLMLAVQWVSFAQLVQYYVSVSFGSSVFLVAVILSGCSTMIYTVQGGFRRDVATDVWQMGLTVVGCSVLLAGIGGSELVAKVSTLGPAFFAVGSHGVVFFIGTLLFVAPTFLVRFDLWQRILTAKSDGSARLAFIVSGAFALLFFLFFGLLGMYAKSIGMQDAKFAALRLIDSRLHGVGLALAIVSFFAAVGSSADTFLGVGGLALTTLVKRSSLEIAAGQPEFKKTARLCTAFVGVAATALALYFGDIINLFSTAFGLLLAFLPTITALFFRSHVKSREALLSSCLALIAGIVGSLFFPRESFLLVIVVALLVYIIVARRQPRRSPGTS